MKGNDNNKLRLRKQRLLARAALKRAGNVKFKPVTSAKWVNVSRAWNGVLLVQIEHDNIRGVTPEMMRWWFENLGRTTTWNGIDFSGPEITFYHLWHHRDHIKVIPLTSGPNGEPNHGFFPGAKSMIQEQFNDFHDKVHHTMLTTRLDGREFTFLIKQFGMTVGRITHTYSSTEDGISFYAETEIGSKIPVFGWLLNWFVIPWVYSKKTAEHWIRHNIEETGRTEDVLPPLYAARDTFI
ncbi:hypothetical protein GCM10008910_24840 [Faecalicatena orotica]|uniref:DAPG hydrolase PhiG domain-containing protein n=1 Tax=Faecalicatena orotica TaxID=1544 RepID=A0A2Y9BLQ7_9FIRM|nr:hypothetical protein [Faecalicatena orotica]PWJ28274.1 hypothetical protein A8806_109154 [Faecalicatena orotica]SSA56729.1 hypothetical protein SAMN05216536_109154 [Faecalicatena orotica]